MPFYSILRHLPYAANAVKYGRGVYSYQKVFSIPPTRRDKFFSFPVFCKREDKRLCTTNTGFYKKYFKKSSVKAKLEGKIMKYPWNSITKVMICGKMDVKLFFPFPNCKIVFLFPPPPSGGGANRLEYTALLYYGEGHL